MQQIEIVVSPTGQSRIETRGFAGAECRQASAFLERALGRRTAEQLTGEFHLAAVPSPLASQREEA